MNFSKPLCGTFLIAVSLLQASVASAVDLNQIDTFEDGTTQNWLAGLLGAPHPAPPANVSSGGPAGVDDNYLLLTAVGGGGPGSKLTVINPAQWSGDYLTAGVNAIAMDVNNLGSGDLHLRLAFENPMGGPPTDFAVSSEAALVSAGSGWTKVRFDISSSGLTTLFGDLNTLLSNTTAIRLYHSPDLNFPGPSIVTQLGVDNVQALAVPEPGAFASLAGLGALALLVGRRRKKRA